MFDIVVSDEQLKTAYGIALSFQIGMRGHFDGDGINKAYGMLGQIAVTDALGAPRPRPTGFDGGYDVIVGNHKADIKTMVRTCPVRSEFVNNLLVCQTKYDVDYYVFTSYNSKTNYLTVCGVYPKKWVMEQARLNRAGDEVRRSDGTKFVAQEDFYEIPCHDLLMCNSVAELRQILGG